MTPKGKTMAARAHAPLVSLCAACLLAVAATSAPALARGSQAADATAGVTDPYTISIPATLSVDADGSGSMQITGVVSSNHRLDVSASSANNGELKLSGSGSDAVSYSLTGASFTASAHATDASIAKTVRAKVTGTPRYQGTYTDTLTFTMSCVATHTLTLDAQSGSLPDEWENPQEFGAGEAYDLPTPTRDGYTFDGWYTAASGGTKVEASGTMGNADVEYHAHWTANVLTINYHSGGAYEWHSYATGQYVSIDETADVVVEIENVGYDRQLPDDTYAKHPQYGILDVARLERHGYHGAAAWTVMYNGSVVEERANDTDSLALGKDVAAHLNVLDQLNKGNVTVDLYPIFAPNTYYIEYNANGGMGTMSLTGHIYDKPTALRRNTFVKDGYAFMGWSESANGSVQYVDGQEINRVTSPSEHVTLYAQWEKNAEADVSSNAAAQAASSQADAVTAAKSSSAADASSSSDAVASSASNAADSAFAEKPSGASADADASARADADNEPAGSDAGDASDQPGSDASAAASADAGASSAGEGADDDAQSSDADASDSADASADVSEAADASAVTEEASAAPEDAASADADEATPEGNAASEEEPPAAGTEALSAEQLLADELPAQPVSDDALALPEAVREDAADQSTAEEGR